MKRFWTSLALVLSATLVVVSVASAHTPMQSGSNGTLAGATVISDSSKSWAIYAELPHAGSAQYYRFDAAKGEQIPIALFASPAEQSTGFVPSFAIMGPSVPDQGNVPSYIEAPPNARRMLFEGAEAARGTYEPFSPSVFFSVATTDFEAPVDGTYYVSVFDDQRGGGYGIAIGKAERFTLYEWITTPLAFFRIYRWEGQSTVVVLLPSFLALVVGVGLLIRRQRRGRVLDLPAWLGAIAGLLFVGSSMTVATQMVFSLARSGPDAGVIVTLVLMTLPLVVGVLTLRLVTGRSGRWTPRSRALLAALGVVAAAVWAGWIVAPALAVVAAFVPSRSADAVAAKANA